VEALPCLLGLLARGVAPYLSSTNGHPDASGQDAIARCVAAAMSADGSR